MLWNHIGHPADFGDGEVGSGEDGPCLKSTRLITWMDSASSGAEMKLEVGWWRLAWGLERRWRGRASLLEVEEGRDT